MPGHVDRPRVQRSRGTNDRGYPPRRARTPCRSLPRCHTLQRQAAPDDSTTVSRCDPRLKSTRGQATPPHSLPHRGPQTRQPVRRLDNPLRLHASAGPEQRRGPGSQCLDRWPHVSEARARAPNSQIRTSGSKSSDAPRNVERRDAPPGDSRSRQDKARCRPTQSRRIRRFASLGRPPAPATDQPKGSRRGHGVPLPAHLRTATMAGVLRRRQAKRPERPPPQNTL